MSNPDSQWTFADGHTAGKAHLGISGCERPQRTHLLSLPSPKALWFNKSHCRLVAEIKIQNGENCVTVKKWDKLSLIAIDLSQGQHLKMD